MLTAHADKHNKTVIVKSLQIRELPSYPNVSHLQSPTMYLIHPVIIVNNHTDQHCRQELI